MSISKVVENIENLLKQPEMIGIGSTRKVYRFENIFTSYRVCTK